MSQRLVGFLQKTLDDLTTSRITPTICLRRTPANYALVPPPEIVSHIFRFCVAGTDPWAMAVPCAPSCTPLALASVCRYWRAVALSTRELWTCFSFPWSSPRLTSLSKVWLARGGDHPIVSALICETPDMQSDDTWDLVHTLCLHATRLRCAQFVIPRSAAVEFPSISGSFPLLTSVALLRSKPQDLPPDHIPGDSYVIADLRDAPCLLDVQLVFVSQYDYIVLPWAQLTRLELCDSAFVVDPGFFLSVFHFCHNLLQCTLINTRGTLALEQQSTSPYTHRKLQHLVVDGFTKNVYGSFTFPSLSNMEIRDCKSITGDLMAFLARSAALKTFSMSFATECNTQSFGNLIYLLPSLTDLTIDCSNFSADYCTTFFNIFGRKAWLCPNLTKLALSDAIPERGFSYLALALMLRARWKSRPHVAALTTCTIVFRAARATRRPLPCVMAQLQNLLCQGMDIRISSPALRWPRHKNAYMLFP
ncbi:hypothetical protein C8R44DRAFT_980435 [Mycena epipterygia]|nr:hypothetical protein C8R44DRAFT_980435 [Mycena epipterygia]